MSSTSRPHFGVLVPVKRVAVAKSRLASLGDDARQQLVAAFAADTVTAVLRCVVVDVVLVVTDDHELAREMRELGAQVVPDGVVDDLNGSLVQAAAELRRRRPDLAVAALCADLPALRSEDLAVALGAASQHPAAFVADAEGTGTTLLAAASAQEFVPCFGESSRKAHLAQGAWQIEAIDVPTLRRDVDTAADLEVVLAMGVGTRTAQVAAGLTL